MLFGITMCLANAIQIPASETAQATSLQPLPLPLVEEDDISPSGQKTTWSCVYFGSYPFAEITDSSWDAVDDYALQDGDLIRDDALYEKLQQAEWEEDKTQLDGVSYVRVNSSAADATDPADADPADAPAEAGSQNNTREVVREQHYRHEETRPWHYFQIMPIRWRVLDVQDDKALLLADRMPDSMPFHAADTDVSWQDSTLRSWLNGLDASANQLQIDYTGTGFIDQAFTPEEKEAIIETRCRNLPNQDYGTFSGEETEDRIFILSNEEVFEGADAGRYGFHPGRDYDDPAKRFTSTLYAKYRGAWWSPVEDYAGNSFWFMRTSGYTPRSVTYICDFGFIYSKGTLVTCSDAGVLPAMWVDLEQAQLEDAGERVSTEIMHIADDSQAVFPVPELTDPVRVEDEEMPGGSYTIWNSVAFGHYPQTEIPAEKAALDETCSYYEEDGRWFRCDPIIWRVLDVSDDTALLMADRCLDSVPYHTEYQDVFWEDSDLRNWLNATDDAESPESDDSGESSESAYGQASFIDMAFTEEEQQAIIRSDVANASNYYFDTACGSGTHDQVFILSEEEVFSSENAVRYGFQPSDAIGDYGRRMVPTDFAVARGAWQSETEETAGIGFWLLRTNGYTEDNVVYVGEKGYLYNRGIPVTCDDAGIVPAIRIRLGAASVTKEADISTQSVKY